MSGLLDRAAAWLIAPPEDGDAARDRPERPRRLHDPDDEPPLRLATASDPPLEPRDDVSRLHVVDEDDLIDLATLGYPRCEPPPAPPPRRFAPPVARRTVESPDPLPADVDPPRIVVLGPPADVPVAAAAAALALRRRTRAHAAVVLLVAPDAEPALPPPTLATPGLPAARMLAARLTGRGIAASAHGRLVWVAQPVHPVRVHAAVADAPVVVGLLGPRSSAGDALIAAHDAALLAADPESPLAELAALDLATVGVPLHVWAPPPGGTARLAALTGWSAPAGIPALVAEARR